MRVLEVSEMTQNCPSARSCNLYSHAGSGYRQSVIPRALNTHVQPCVWGLGAIRSCRSSACIYSATPPRGYGFLGLRRVRMSGIGHGGDDVSALHEARHAFHDQQPR